MSGYGIIVFNSLFIFIDFVLLYSFVCLIQDVFVEIIRSVFALSCLVAI